MKKLTIILALAAMVAMSSCNSLGNKEQKSEQTCDPMALVEDSIKCVGDIPLPDGRYKRDSVEPGSFAEYLRNLPLKPADYPTHLYDGTEKANQRAGWRVVDMDIDNVDLQQCADACIRLYAEYLWHSKQYDKIKFHFVSGFLADYDRWAHGERIRVDSSQSNDASSG